MFRLSTPKENEPISESDPSSKIKLRRRKLVGRRKLCPKCLSQLVLASSLSGWLVPEFYACPKCGYSGYVAFEETPKEK